MKRAISPQSRRRAFTLIEVVVAAAILAVVLAVLVESSVAIQKGMAATDQFAFRTANGNRLSDAVAQDLRRAVGVGTITGGVYTKLSPSSVTVSAGGIVTDPNTVAAVSETVTLAITIPDNYASNTPNNTLAATYKTTLYPRATLNTAAAYNGSSGSAAVLNGVVPWNTAVKGVTSGYTNTFAPAFSSIGTGLLQIRYTRGPRSATDSTSCYFRTEYPSNSNTANSAPVEIAEQVVDPDSVTSLVIIDPDYGSASDTGAHYRIQSNFTPRYRFIANTYNRDDNQFVDVYLRNPRRD